MSLILNERILINTLRISAIALTAIAALSTTTIIFTSRPVPEFSYDGWKTFLELFSFPLGAVASILAVLTLEVAVRALLESIRQNVISASVLVQSSFIEFTKNTTAIPMAVFDPDPFAAIYNDKWRDELFHVEYLAPVFTLQRLFDPQQTRISHEPPLNPKLLSQTEVVLSYFHSLRNGLARGDPSWLRDLAHLMVATRQLRTYLAVRLPKMAEWDFVTVLESNVELGPRIRCPPYRSGMLLDVVSDVRIELLCIACPLGFSPMASRLVIGLGEAAFRLESFRSNLPDNLRKTMTNKLMYVIWNESDCLRGHKIEI